ncbi:MAG: hypothetical protein U1B94_10185, partial [candidate division NC10 bacterium]|nr:hypothetical protein [candidate division NC10 bacterium]
MTAVPVRVAPAVPDLRDLTLPELGEWVTGLGEAPYRARQVFRWLWRRPVTGFHEMTDLPAELRRVLEARAQSSTLETVEVRASRDGTRKLLLRLADGGQIEAVLIPEGRRLTAC